MEELLRNPTVQIWLEYATRMYGNVGLVAGTMLITPILIRFCGKFYRIIIKNGKETNYLTKAELVDDRPDYKADKEVIDV